MKMNSCRNSQTIKRKSTGSSSNPASADEQTPPTRVRVSSSSPDGSYHHSFEPSDEFKAKRDHLFKIMPQGEPHLDQLEKSSSSSARKGFRLVLDIDFVNLSEKFSKPVDPLEFSEGIEEYSSQLLTLEQNGYNVVKLWERFDKLRRLSVDEKRIREEKKEKEDERKDKNVKACITLNKIDSLKKELKGLEATAKAQSKEIETVELMEKCYDEEREKILKEMSATATPW